MRIVIDLRSILSLHMSNLEDITIIMKVGETLASNLGLTVQSKLTL